MVETFVGLLVLGSAVAGFIGASWVVVPIFGGSLLVLSAVRAPSIFMMKTRDKVSGVVGIFTVATLASAIVTAMFTFGRVLSWLL